MADEINSSMGLKAQKDALGYTPSPDLQYYQSQLSKEYDEKHAPLAEAIIRGVNPQADPQAKLAAADALKKATGVDQPQYMNAFQSIVNMNPRDLMISLNGGANVPSQAYDDKGNRWTKVFNERKTAANPYGEVRHYVDSQGKQYSPEEAEKVAGGAIVSLNEIPLAQQNFYKAKNILASRAATTQADEWNRAQKIGAVATANAPVIIDTSNQLNDLYKQILPFSVDPKTRELLAGIGDMRTGNQRMLKTITEKLKEALKDNSVFKNNEDFRNQTGGFNFGFNLNEQKKLVNADGTNTSLKDIERASDSIQNSASTDNNVSARKADLMNRAQILAAKGELKNLDSIQMAINLEYQKALAINAIENAGGIGVAKPTLPHEVGDAFSLAWVKNRTNKDYGALAQMYGSQVKNLQATSRGNTPAVGDIETMVANHPDVVNGKRQAIQEISSFLKEAEPILSQIKNQSPSMIVGQPNASEPMPPPKVASPSVAASIAQPTGSRPPVKVESEKPKTDHKKVLTNIFGG